MKLSMKLFILSQVVVTGVVVAKKHPDKLQSMFGMTKASSDASAVAVPTVD
uniref:Uncharacterized protein n=1 Tax=Anopheles arabiensis TaxID=7173 RepID=A0A2C9GQB6_ANOAR